MSTDAIIVLMVIGAAVVLFATEWLSIDLVAILIMVTLTVTGVISTEEGLSGFSNPATITVAFMFVLSYALLKTGSLQRIGPYLGPIFKKNFNLGILIMMMFIGVVSAFINNTPIVAMFIPVMVSVANLSGYSPSKLLIPLSYASIFGGMCTMIGTSTNMLVSGIAVKNGLDDFPMFLSAPVGIVFIVVGAIYIYFFGKKLLPDRISEENLSKKFGMRDYLTEIEVLDESEFVGQRIMDSILATELEIDVIEVRRNGGTLFTLPPGDFVIKPKDVLKVRCDVEKIKALKDRLKVNFNTDAVRINENEIQKGDTSILELIITSGSEFEGKNLREMDFRRRYRAIPLAILHREEVVHENLHSVRLNAGDVILTEIKTHRLPNLKRQEMTQKSPFIVLSEEGVIDFNRKKFLTVFAVIAGVVGLATAGVIPIVMSTLLGAMVLVLSKTINMREVYESIEWKIIFLLAGALSLGVAMVNSGLASIISDFLVNELGNYGPVVILSGMYLTTSLLTEIMSNNASAALIAPIAITTADKLDVSPYPFLIAVMIAASASFMTPIGYHTNTMVYTAGQYRFRDFFRIGVWLNLGFWLIATFIIPLFYPF
ncbi:SLC13 family permease [Marinoscillum furvescens]|uniref:TrkA family protein n=1 Tax=Marinoscillum furvescens DSM 4134 TaxID=1122208 RepID=A0A3D9L2F5_MARFU|nr:SLC13 family permease [Marinoscillum furvescens]RED95604.1 TrkA family protein [Marinoscillum furvescens DSM 4134]